MSDQILILGIAERGYWTDANNEGHFFDRALAEGLIPLFSEKAVADFGCGKGDYVRFFREHGIDALGFDGNPLTEKLTQGLGKVCDLSKPAKLGTFDWVLSLEVGEHIPAVYEQTFLKNIFDHSREGAILSWAVLGQEGRGHVNTRDNVSIKELFAAEGYTNDTALEAKLRSCSTLDWFKQTLMVFRR